MDPITIGLAVQAAGGLVNYLSNMDAANKAATLADQNFQRWMAIQLPNPADQQLALKQLSSAGTLSPQLETQINQAPSELNRVTTDPQTQAAQMDALRSLQDQGYRGGLNLQDQATLQQAQSENQDQARGNSAAIMQNLAQRGASNSGFGVAAQLSNAQNAANQNASAGLNVAAQAQNRALSAIQGAGSLAGNMQAANLNQQNTVAQSQNAINQFNTQNAIGNQQRNVSSLNSAQAANLENAQNISNGNVGIQNQQQIANKNLIQQNYENQVQQAQGAAGASAGQANAAQNQANATGNFATNIGNMVGGVAAKKANQDWWDNYTKSQNSAQSTLNNSISNPTGMARNGVGQNTTYNPSSIYSN